MADLPSGTVTFLFTDIEGSTHLWEQHPHAMPGALAHHDAILREATAAHGGVVFRTVGDAFCTAFASAPAALRAALAAQGALQDEPWGQTGPIRVRMAVHTGAVEIRDGEYQGQPLNRIARILAAGHGGQTLLSAATVELVRDDLPPGVELRDMGAQRLKDLTRPEHIFQIVAADLSNDFPPLKTLDRRPHNLPAQPTALIGREKEVASVCSLLRRADARLVTLTGPGGTGKTRLGLQVAAELLDDFKDGVWFVNLAPIGDPNLVAATAAQTLGINESAGRSLLDQLKDYLREKQLLLLLDNFEQVAEAAPLVSELLTVALGLKALVTSRMPLHLSGEREYAVPPLGLPPAAVRTLERSNVQTFEVEISQYEAVRLFIERAQAVKADFAVTNANAPAVAEICYRLDGLPLAIELAAARVKLFPPQALLARLGSRLKLLTGGARDLPARQQTIRSTIDWSYQLLDEDEKRLFTRLGVFVGGCTLEAAEAVCNADGDPPMDVVDAIAALLDQSLVRQEEGLDGEPRFTMLETIREYALEQLVARSEADATRQQHADYFLRLAEQAEPWLLFRRPEREPWLERLEAEHDNLRAALEWFGDRGEVEHSVRLAGALTKFWSRRYHWDEGNAWLQAALTRSSTISVAVRAKALVGAGHLAFWLCDFTGARVYAEEGLSLFRGLGDKPAIAYALLSLGAIVLNKGEYAMARACAEEGLALFDEVNDQWGRPYALQLLGQIAAVQGDLTQAAVYNEQILAFSRQLRDKTGIAMGLTNAGIIAQSHGDWAHTVELYAESLALYREVGDKAITIETLHDLGGAVLHQGDVLRAAACFAEGLALSRELGDRSGIALSLAGMAGVASVQGYPERSAQLFGTAEALFASMSLVVAPVHRAEYDRNHEIARAQLGEDAFAAAWEAGRAMTIEQAIAYALEPPPETPSAPTPPTAPQPAVAGAEYPAGLTAREVEVLRLVAQGLTDAQVAERLIVSAHTVHAHLRSIYGKLEVSSRAAATRFAVDQRLI